MALLRGTLTDSITQINIILPYLKEQNPVFNYKNCSLMKYPFTNNIEGSNDICLTYFLQFATLKLGINLSTSKAIHRNCFKLKLYIYLILSNLFD